MKITTFNPQIITKNGENIRKLFEELGFEIRHDRKEIGSLDFEGLRLKDENGSYLDIIKAQEELPLEHDLTAIRMNVDDYEKAYELLKAHGFENFYGDHFVDSPSAKSAMMISPGGLMINLVYHKKHDGEK